MRFGDWLLPRLNIHLGVGIIALIINALVGAIVLLVVLRLIGGGAGDMGGGADTGERSEQVGSRLMTSLPY